MKHVDLFSGIGGFALAAKWVWGDDYENVLFCDNNKFCQEVLKKNFGKDILIYGDIKEVTVERLIADTTSERCDDRGDNRQGGQVQEVAERCIQEDQQAGYRWISGFGAAPVVDLLTGGFPCQGFSEAGKRRGTKDDRYLWPEMYRVIKDLKPRWVVAENVRGILVTEGGVVFEQVHLDLEAEGYEVQAFVIPACAVNAPHRRDRVWFIAHTRYWNGQGTEDKGELGGQVLGTQDAVELERSDSNAPEGSVADSESVVCSRSEPSGDRQGRSEESLGDESRYDSNSSVQGLEGGQCVHSEGFNGQFNRDGGDERRSWSQNWFEVARSLCGMDDGFPNWLDRYFNKIISQEDYGATKEDRIKGVYILREAICKEEIWQRVGGIFKVSEKELLLAFLFHVDKESQKQNFTLESKENNKSEGLCELWRHVRFKCSPYRRQCQEQSAVELTNVVSELPYSTAQCFCKVWDYLQCAYSSMTSPEVVLDGLKLTKSKHRVERLKALGNAIVPQVAAEIFKAIKYADTITY